MKGVQFGLENFNMKQNSNPNSISPFFEIIKRVNQQTLVQPSFISGQLERGTRVLSEGTRYRIM